MSEFYEGVVICGGTDAVTTNFSSLDSHRPLRLVRLDDRTYGIYPVKSRSDPLDESATKTLARALSRDFGSALAVSYDNRCGFNFATLFRNGTQHRTFDEHNELWVALDDDGHPTVDGPQLTVAELDTNGEYDCVRSAIDAGLAHLGVDSSISVRTLKQAFCYDDGELVAETSAT